MPDKSLGQHWLRDEATLETIASYANLNADDTVLEIGPGLGTLTAVLAKRANHVVVVEFDQDLAKNLPPAPNLEIINADFLQFDLNQLPKNYKVVANIPYYITNKIVMKLLTDRNKPNVAVLLVQKEVAERLAAEPGAMSILGVAAQIYADVSLGAIVPAALFDPPPKVDSQIVILKTRSNPLFANLNEKDFFRVVKAGFSQRRKKLRTALAGGLNISVADAENLLRTAVINPSLRAQDLTIDDWYSIMSSMDA